MCNICETCKNKYECDNVQSCLVKWIVNCCHTCTKDFYNLQYVVRYD